MIPSNRLKKWLVHLYIKVRQVLGRASADKNAGKDASAHLAKLMREPL